MGVIKGVYPGTYALELAIWGLWHEVQNGFWLYIYGCQDMANVFVVRYKFSKLEDRQLWRAVSQL